MGNGKKGRSKKQRRRSRAKERTAATDPKHAGSDALISIGSQILNRLLDMLNGSPARPTNPKQVPSQNRGPKLSKAFKQWHRRGEIEGIRRVNSMSVIQARGTIRRFIELFGDVPIGDITKDMVHQFRDTMIQLPTHLPKAIRDEPIQDIIRRTDLDQFPKRYAGTVNQSLRQLGTILNHAETKGDLDEIPGWTNPFSGRLRFRLDRRISRRNPFDASELALVFNTSIYSDNELPPHLGPAAFWYPLIALLAGLRLGEITHLRAEDIYYDRSASHWFFQIRPRDSNLLKSYGSERNIPVHPELQRIGLIRLRESVAGSGRVAKGDLWPQLGDSEGHSRMLRYSAWFRTWRRTKLGINDRTKVFHSFRHNFKRAARDAGLSEEMNDWLCGHSRWKVVGRGYGYGFSADVLADAIDRIQFPIDLTHLEWRESPIPSTGKIDGRKKPEPLVPDRDTAG